MTVAEVIWVGAPGVTVAKSRVARTLQVIAGAIAVAILSDDARHDGGWTLGCLAAEIAQRGGPAISPRWLSHQLRPRGLPSASRATPSKAAKTKRRWKQAANALPT